MALIALRGAAPGKLGLTAYISAIVLYLLIGLLAIAPHSAARLGLQAAPLRVEAALLITDPGKSVDAIKHHDDVREVFLNPPDIGGRYSALTYVGLVPASLIGIDLDAILASGLDDDRRLPRAGPGVQPGPVARTGHRDAGQGRPRQAHVPGRRRDRELRGVDRAAHRGEHRQARRRDRPGRPRAARARSSRTVRTGPSSGSP